MIAEAILALKVTPKINKKNNKVKLLLIYNSRVLNLEGVFKFIFLEIIFKMFFILNYY